MVFNFQKLVRRYCRWRHSDVLINSNLYCLGPINYHKIIVPLKQSPAAHRIHLPAGRRVSIHSAKHHTAHRTGCGPAVQISSSPKTSGLQIRRIWTQWTITCRVQCWRLAVSLKQSRRKSTNSSKHFRLSGATCLRNWSTKLGKTSQSDWRLVLELAVDTSNIYSDNGILAFDH